MIELKLNSSFEENPYAQVLTPVLPLNWKAFNSEGCKFRKYKLTHLFEPEAVIPKNKTTISRNKQIK